MPNDSIWSRAYRTPFAGPYSAQAIVQGVGDAIGQPLANDARAIKRGISTMPNDSIWSRAYRTPFAGPYSAQAIVQGVGDAIGQPLANDARAIKRVRNQYPTIDTLASVHPVIAGAQVANDIAAGDTGFDTAANIVQMIPAVKPLGLLAKQKAANIFGRRWGVDMPATLRRNTIITSGQVLGQTNDAE